VAPGLFRSSGLARERGPAIPHGASTRTLAKRESTRLASIVFPRHIRGLHRHQLDCLVHIHRHQARHARLVHGDTDELLGNLHGDLVVGDDNELHAV